MKTDGPAFAPVFASEILQILSNFIVNSFDAAPSEGGILCVRVRNVATVSATTNTTSVLLGYTAREPKTKPCSMSLRSVVWSEDVLINFTFNPTTIVRDCEMNVLRSQERVALRSG